jgi:hypothetical protein
MKAFNCSRSLANMQATLTETRDGLGKCTKAHHFINEIRLLSFALHGCVKRSLDLKNLPRVQLRLLRRVICQNTRLIAAHVAYAERKQACRQLVLSQAAKSPT